MLFNCIRIQRAGFVLINAWADLEPPAKMSLSVAWNRRLMGAVMAQIELTWLQERLNQFLALEG